MRLHDLTEPVFYPHAPFRPTVPTGQVRVVTTWPFDWSVECPDLRIDETDVDEMECIR